MKIADVVEEATLNLLRRAVVTIPSDVEEALREAYRREEGTAKSVMEAIIRNIELARKMERPLCQDTGLISYYVEAGSGCEILREVEAALLKATERATREIPLRPNAVDSLTNLNSGNNIGRHVPVIEWTISDRDDIILTVLPKGGGSENVTKLKMLSPGVGMRGVLGAVLDTILEAGPYPCPPTIVGIGLGGSAETALKLSKRSLLRPLNIRNADPRLAKYEERIYELANELGIGPMGLGGKTTVLGVKMDYAHRHPASLPLAVSFQCWAARRTSVKISPEGEVEYLGR